MEKTLKTTQKEVQSRIPELVALKGWDRDEWIGRCYLAGIQSRNTALKALDGATDFQLGTILDLVEVLGVKQISDIFPLVQK